MRVHITKPERPQGVSANDFELVWSVLCASRDLSDFGTVSVACRVLDDIMNRRAPARNDWVSLCRYFR